MSPSTTTPSRGAAIGDALRPVLEAPGTRPPRPSALSASTTFFWRAMLKIKHSPEALSDVFVLPVIGTLMFTYLFGGALAGSTDDYVQYVLPGMLVLTVLLFTMYTGYGLNGDVTTGVLDRFRTLAIWRPAPLVGALLGDGVRYTVSGAIVIVLGLVMGFRPEAGAVGVLASLVLLFVFCFAVSWVWTLLGLIVRTPQSLISISMGVLFPLGFVSNVFVEPTTMPSWLEAFVDVNPISVLVTAIRGLMDGTATSGQIGAVLLISAAFVVVFGSLTMRRYNAER